MAEKVKSLALFCGICNFKKEKQNLIIIDIIRVSRFLDILVHTAKFFILF